MLGGADGMSVGADVVTRTAERHGDVSTRSGALLGLVAGCGP